MKFYRITVNAPQHHSTVIAAEDLDQARSVGLKQLGVLDPPPGGVSTSGHRIDVGECTAEEWLAEESRRRGVPASEIQLPTEPAEPPPPGLIEELVEGLPATVPPTEE